MHLRRVQGRGLEGTHESEDWLPDWLAPLDPELEPEPETEAPDRALFTPPLPTGGRNGETGGIWRFTNVV